MRTARGAWRKGRAAYGCGARHAACSARSAAGLRPTTHSPRHTTHSTRCTAHNLVTHGSRHARCTGPTTSTNVILHEHNNTKQKLCAHDTDGTQRAQHTQSTSSTRTTHTPNQLESRQHLTMGVSKIGPGGMHEAIKSAERLAPTKHVRPNRKYVYDRNWLSCLMQASQSLALTNHLNGLFLNNPRGPNTDPET